MSIIFKVLKLSFDINKKYFFVALFSTILAAIAPTLSILVFTEVLSSLVRAKPEPEKILLLVLIYPFLTFLDNVMYRVKNSLTDLAFRYDMTEYFFKTFLKKFISLDMEMHENPKYADLINNARDGHEWRQADVLRFGWDAVYDFVGAITSGLAIFLVQPIFSLLIGISIIPRIFVDIKMEDAMWNMWTLDTDTRRRYGTLIHQNENPQYVKDIKLMNIGTYLQNKLFELYTSVVKKQKKILFNKLKWHIFAGLLPIAVNGVALYYLVNQYYLGAIEIGAISFTLFNLLFFRDRVAQLLSDITYALAQGKYVKKVFEMFELRNKIVNIPNPIKDIDTPPSIEFRNVSFKYPDTEKYILKDFNLKIDKSETVAIVGENGAGKSTLVKLILRLYETTSGQVLINGLDIKTLDIESWRKECSVLLQDFTTFEVLTVKENIGLGDIEKFERETTDEKVKEAARDAKAEEFILSNKKGYEEPIGRDFNGVDFSGGQHQRIALARTFYRDSGLVIMDEPTSAVDAKAESEIFETIKGKIKSKTVIFISHRFSTVRMADRILVIDHGKITEEGTHEKLLNNNGLYSTMFKLQAKGYV